MNNPTLEILRKALNSKEKKFADCYLGAARHNATRAAQMAGYSGSSNVLGVTAYRLLKKPHIKAYIDQFLTDSTLSAQETLARIGSIARASIADVLRDDCVWIDLEKARANGSIHFVKKIRSKKRTRVISNEMVMTPEGKRNIKTSIVSEEIEIEMYSALEALRDLARYHNLSSDKMSPNALLQNTEVHFFLPHNKR